jgi:hypothetical protein
MRNKAMREKEMRVPVVLIGALAMFVAASGQAVAPAPNAHLHRERFDRTGLQT